ncbi:MAG: fucose isomerase [Vulcanisaeta sp. JCHS_4]|jgi:L-fucose isomerase and related proteins|nr:MAG: fucose isomerase [Vulcanisaeta sp. JCHS_4]
MVGIVVLGFVSPLHKDKVPVVRGIDKIITSIDELKDLSIGDSLVVAVILSGGVSRLVGELVSVNRVRRAVLVSYPGFNSLASALDARALLRDLGVDSGILHINDLDELGSALRVARAIARAIGVKVALLGVDRKSDISRSFEDRFDSKVDIINMSEFERLVENADEGIAQEFANLIKGRVKFEIGSEKLLEVGKIYAAIRGLYARYDATAINCFPYLVEHGVTPCLALARLNEEGLIAACEADLRALFSMMLTKELTGYSGWIANVNHVEGSTVTMSHCTIALNMIRNPRVLTHFESGYPYGLTGELIFNEVTGISVSSDFRRMGVFTAKVVNSGLMSNNICRAQAVLNLGVDASRVVKLAPYNHHVIVPGDITRELEVIASVLGMEYVRYN